jgi:hypothetical protein
VTARARTVWLEVRILPGKPRDLPETAKKPAIGGVLRLRFGLRGDRFWPECDFGRVASGPRNPVSPMQIDLDFSFTFFAR